MEVIKNEFKNIIKNKLLLASFIVICAIPLIYASFFLKSVWDPYGKTNNLPIAVVNKDQSVMFNDQKINVGSDLVNSLKENDNFKWSFVSEQQALAGLKNKEYYMIISIPNNFSQNAATLLDNKPQKMKINYETNGALNYLGEVISEAAAKEIRGEVANKVTNSYALAMFKQINNMKDGFKQIDDGLNQLDDGVYKIKAGDDELNNSISLLASKSLQFSNGETTFDLKLNSYFSKIMELEQGSELLSNNYLLFDSAIENIANILTLLSKGSTTLNDSLYLYTDNAQLINKGLKQITLNNDQIKDGLNDFSNGLSNITLLINLSNDIMQQMNQLSNNSLTNIELNDLQERVVALNERLKALHDSNGSSASLNLNNNKIINELNNEIDGLINRINQSTFSNNESILNDFNNSKSMQSLSNEQRLALSNDLKTSLLQKNNHDSLELQGIRDDLLNIKAKINTSNITPKAANSDSLNDIVNDANLITNDLKALFSKDMANNNQRATINYQLQLLNNGLMSLASESSKASPLFLGINNYLDMTKQASMGLNTLNSNNESLLMGSKQLNQGLMALNEESPLLRANSSQINDGINKISSSLGLLTNASEALSQASAQLKQGSLQLSSGSAKLMQGSQQLNEALTNLKTGSDTLVTKVNDGLKAINTINLNDNVAKQMSNPSQLVHQKYSDVPNYGHALAPYVLSLSLFVGCLIFNFIMPVRRKATQDAKVKQWWLSKIILGLIGALSMALILASVMLLLGLEPDHLGRYYLMAIITAMCYMSVIMFLAISFDNPGRFLAMVLLVLQLSGSGGTFPMPLTGSFFNTIHPLLPMTYSIYGFREAISSGLGINTFTNAIMVLIIIIVVAYLLLYFSMKVLDKRMEHLKNKFKPQKSND